MCEAGEPLMGIKLLAGELGPPEEGRPIVGDSVIGGIDAGELLLRGVFDPVAAELGTAEEGRPVLGDWVIGGIDVGELLLSGVFDLVAAELGPPEEGRPLVGDSVIGGIDAGELLLPGVLDPVAGELGTAEEDPSDDGGVVSRLMLGMVSVGSVGFGVGNAGRIIVP
uniref:Uncharacterized protein n=1 Tax=Steinernema glaseri TaxID=37863 RepID=A0A1I7ZIR9_9BILA